MAISHNLHTRLDLPPFRAPWWLRSGHVQTLAAAFWPGRRRAYQAVPRQVTLDDGDVVVVHDDRPDGWIPGQRCALLMHGLIGNHQSPLLVRLASKLVERGVRVFRWDFRGCGAGTGLARLPYHAGCSRDLAQVIHAVSSWCLADEPVIPTQQQNSERSNVAPFLTLFGVSLSGNVLLKYLGEAPDQVSTHVAQGIAVNPPIDLGRSVGTLKSSINRWYDRHFVAALIRDVNERKRLRPDAPMPAQSRRPKGLFEFDDWYTAPISGFASASDYYQRCSSLQFMHQIHVPTTVITSCDDPMVPVEMFTTSVDRWSSSTRLFIANGGGHVGYVARRGLDPDQLWLDWRVVDLVTH